MEYFLPTKENLKPITGNLVYEDNKAALQAWTAYDENNLNRETNYATTTYPLDLATVPGTAGLPAGWANGLSLDSPFASGKAGSPLPFARGGKASPRDFARGMMAASATQRAMKFTLPPEGSGLDALGLLTSALAQTGLMGRVESLEEDYPAASLDEYYRTGQSPEAPVRFFREDIEKLSLLVPDISRIQVGDLLVHYGEEEGQSKDSFKLGIVVYAPMAGRPLPGQDGSAYFKQVVVLGVNEGERQVGLYTWLSNGTSRGFSEKPEGWQLRRLFAKPAPVTLLKSQTMGIMRSFGAEGVAAAEASAKPKITLDGVVTYLTLSYSKSYEATALNKSEPWRWIPNTGEYLEFENLKLNAYDKTGSSPIDFGTAYKDSQYTVSLGAIDRGYDASKSEQGNVYNNTGNGFELAAHVRPNFATEVPFSALRLLNKLDGTYDSRQYSDGRRGPAFSIEKSGRIIMQIRDSYDGTTQAAIHPYFAIRPLPDKVRPGDDILLTAIITFRSGKKLTSSEQGVALEDKAYLAVYDKKMLWRANLYINEKKDDWNNLHPWNAPPENPTDASNVPNGGVPPWWNASWGYNEWNRRIGTFKDGAPPLIGSISELPAGDGTQAVISFPAYQPARGDRTISDRVAYSYPQHSFELHAGDSGSQDSPFDFVKKLTIQIRALQDWYNEAGDMFRKPRKEWRTEIASSSNIADFSFVDYTSYCFDVAPEITETNWLEKRASLAKKVSKWTKATPPNGKWINYIAKDPGNEKPTASFFPGLGLAYWAEKNKLWPNLQAGIKDAFEPANSTLKRQYVLEAGTDCIGFAQRSASYGEDPYKWLNLYAGFSETDSSTALNIYRLIGPADATPAFYRSIADFSANRRRYPRVHADAVKDSLTEYGVLIAERDPTATSISRDDPDDNPILGEFIYLVPGDIFYYRKGAPSALASSVAHIAIIQNVESSMLTANETENMKQVSLIESEFGGLDNYIMKDVNTVEKYHTLHYALGKPTTSDLRLWRVVRLSF